MLLLFSHPVVSDSLRPHGLQHPRPPSPSPTPAVCPSSRPLHWWCHPAISSSDALFSFCPHSYPALGSFLMGQLFASGGQSTGASASASVLPTSIQGWFPLRLSGLISLLSRGTFRGLLQHRSLKAWILWHSAFLPIRLSQPYVTPGKTTALTTWTVVGKVTPAFQHAL